MDSVRIRIENRGTAAQIEPVNSLNALPQRNVMYGVTILRFSFSRTLVAIAYSSIWKTNCLTYETKKYFFVILRPLRLSFPSVAARSCDP